MGQWPQALWCNRPKNSGSSRRDLGLSSTWSGFLPAEGFWAGTGSQKGLGAVTPRTPAQGPSQTVPLGWLFLARDEGECHQSRALAVLWSLCFLVLHSPPGCVQKWTTLPGPRQHFLCTRPWDIVYFIYPASNFVLLVKADLYNLVFISVAWNTIFYWSLKWTLKLRTGI